MPVLGLGVFRMANGHETEQAVEWALEAGYRHIDTASMYRNERSVGAALRRSGLPREDVFVTTKLMPVQPSPARALDKSLRRLGIDYVDLSDPLARAARKRAYLAATRVVANPWTGPGDRRKQLRPGPARGAHRLCRDRSRCQPGAVQPVSLSAPTPRVLRGPGSRVRGLQPARAGSRARAIRRSSPSPSASNAPRPRSCFAGRSNTEPL